MNIIKVDVYPSDDKYVAQAEGMPSVWSKGNTIDEAIAKFKKEYADILTIPFRGGSNEWDFHVRLKG